MLPCNVKLLRSISNFCRTRLIKEIDLKLYEHDKFRLTFFFANSAHNGTNGMEANG